MTPSDKKEADVPSVAATAAPAPAEAVPPQTAVPAAATVAKAAPATAKAAAGKSPAVKRAPAAKSVKPLDPEVQASKEALAKALAAAQAVKIEKPAGEPPKPAKAAKAEKAEKPAKAEKEAKAPKPRKPKLVRDSFTMPENEYVQIDALKERLLDKGRAAKKSELLRAGVALLAALGDDELAAAMQKVEVLKTGRPAKSGK